MPIITLNPAVNADNNAAYAKIATQSPYTGVVGHNAASSVINTTLFFGPGIVHKELAITSVYIGTPTASPPGNKAGKAHQGGFIRFTGVSIPQNSTINSATLNVYAVDAGVGATYPEVKFKVDARQAPGNPTTVKKIFSPTSVLYGSPFINITNTGLASVAGSYNLYQVSVSGQVQTLVNTYDYSSGEMVIYSTAKVLGNDGMCIYGKKGGTTKQPELVINYTAPSLILQDKTTYVFK